MSFLEADLDVIIEIFDKGRLAKIELYGRRLGQVAYLSHFQGKAYTDVLCIEWPNVDLVTQAEIRRDKQEKATRQFGLRHILI